VTVQYLDCVVNYFCEKQICICEKWKSEIMKAVKLQAGVDSTYIACLCILLLSFSLVP